MKYTNITFALIAVLIVSLASVAWYVFQNPEGRIHPQLVPPDSYWSTDDDDIYGKTGIVSIAGREFEIPIAYVDGNFQNGRKEDSVVLVYVLPGFKSPLEYTNKSERQALVLQGRMKGMILEDPKNKAPLEKYIDLMTQMNRVGYPEENREYGLERYPSPGPQGPYDRGADDLYIERASNGSISSVVECSPLGRDVNPRCIHMFDDKGLRYQIRYPADELPNWQVQRQEAISFIDAFEKD